MVPDVKTSLRLRGARTEFGATVAELPQTEVLAYMRGAPD